MDFLLFDRASAQYSGDDLTRFLSTYTAALNLIDILFLALLAGPLMRRFGLRLGLTFNPVVVVGILAVMVVVAAGSGTASFGLFVLAGVLRISDIAATDGTTRTSINAAFQVVQREERLAVQAVVEGIGVPVAIGATGVLLLALDALDLGVGAVIVFGLVLCVIWTAVAVGVYRSYKHALADELRRGSSLAGDFAVSAEADVAAVQALLRSDDARNVRVGLDLLAGISSTASEVELRQLAEHADPEVRARALSQLAATGYAGDREGLVALLDDPERSVRAAALDAVVVADGDDPEVVRRVVAAVADPRTAGRANAALRRLGEVGIPILAAELGRSGKTPRAPLVRAAAGAACEQGIEVIAPALDHPDRAVVLTALDALDAHDARDVVPSDVLERAFQDASTLAAHALAARSKLATEDGFARPGTRRRDRPRAPARNRRARATPRREDPRGGPRDRSRRGRPPRARSRSPGCGAVARRGCGRAPARPLRPHGRGAGCCAPPCHCVSATGRVDRGHRTRSRWCLALDVASDVRSRRNEERMKGSIRGSVAG